MKNSKSKTFITKKDNYQGLTKKKLQFMLPSTQQLRRNSSMKYNGKLQSQKKNIQKNQFKNLQQKLKPAENDKENKQNEIILQQDHEMKKKQVLLKKQCSLDACQQFNFKAQSHHSILTQKTYASKPLFSAMVLPLQEQAQQSQKIDEEKQQITSINNILPKNKLDQSSTKQQKSKKKLKDRIQKLQNLVGDIISGKVSIGQPVLLNKRPSKRKEKNYSMKMKKQQQLTKRTIKSKTSFKDVNRSACTSKSLKQNMSISKIESQQNKQMSMVKRATDSSRSAKSGKSAKLESSVDQKKKGSARKITKQNKPYVIKKKNNLRLTSNYQPIISQIKKQYPKFGIKYVSPIIPNSNSDNYGKLRLMSSLVPKIIQL